MNSIIKKIGSFCLKIVSKLFSKFGLLINYSAPSCPYYSYPPKTYDNSKYEYNIGDTKVLLPLSGQAINKLLTEYKFDSVIDIGCGQGIQTEVFIQNNKTVTSLDYGESVYFKANSTKPFKKIICDFNLYDFKGETFDCVWCSHVLEHQLNVNQFLTKIYSILKEGGVLAITVPPLKHEMVGGHVSLWTPGILLYNLILAGFDCKEAAVKTYGYNISVIVKKKTINNIKQILSYDCGDIRKLKEYFPKDIIWNTYGDGTIEDSFDDRIISLNWD